MDDEKDPKLIAIWSIGSWPLLQRPVCRPRPGCFPAVSGSLRGKARVVMSRHGGVKRCWILILLGYKHRMEHQLYWDYGSTICA